MIPRRTPLRRVIPLLAFIMSSAAHVRAGTIGLDGTGFDNDWGVSIYPPAAKVIAAPSTGVTIADRLDAPAAAALEAGAAPVAVEPAPLRDELRLSTGHGGDG